MKKDQEYKQELEQEQEQWEYFFSQSAKSLAALALTERWCLLAKAQEIKWLYFHPALIKRRQLNHISLAG